MIHLNMHLQYTDQMVILRCLWYKTTFFILVVRGGGEMFQPPTPQTRTNYSTITYNHYSIIIGGTVEVTALTRRTQIVTTIITHFWPQLRKCERVLDSKYFIVMGGEWW